MMIQTTIPGGMLPEDDSDDGDDVDDVDGPEINPGYTPKFVFKKDSRKSFVFRALRTQISKTKLRTQIA